MSSRPKGIEGNASIHRSLVQRIDALADISSELDSQKRNVVILSRQLEVAEDKVKELAAATIEKRNIYEGLRDSLGRKFTAKMSSRKADDFETRKVDAERAYTTALEMEIQEERDLDHLRVKLTNARKEVDTLLPKAQDEPRLRKELHELYEDVFLKVDSNEFPQEKNLRSTLQHAKSVFRETEAAYHQEKKAKKLLSHTLDKINSCKLQITRAEDSTEFHDMLHGATHALEVEQESMERAESYACSARALLEEAHKTVPAVDHSASETFRISQSNNNSFALGILGSSSFERSFILFRRGLDSQANTHQENLRAQKKITEQFEDKVVQEVDASTSRLSRLHVERDSARSDIKEAQDNLDRCRRSVFEKGASEYPTDKDSKWDRARMAQWDAGQEDGDGDGDEFAPPPY